MIMMKKNYARLQKKTKTKSLTDKKQRTHYDLIDIILSVSPICLLFFSPNLFLRVLLRMIYLEKIDEIKNKHLKYYLI